MTTKKLKSYTLFSSLFLATVFATNTAFADDVVSNDQANQPTASQEQAAPATGDQTVLQDAQAGNNNAASNQHEAPVTDPTVREINKVDNGDGTSTTTSEVTSQDLEAAKADFSKFNEDNKDTVNPAANLTEANPQEQANVEAAHADNQKQAENIEKSLANQKAKLDQYKVKLENYQRALAAKPELDKKFQEDLVKYQADKKDYDAKLKAWQDYQEQVKNGTAAGRVETAQGLVYQSEPGAVISLEGVKNYITKKGMQEVTSNSDVLQHYNTDNYGNDKLTEENPYSGTEDTWFKMQTGDTVTATYSNLTKSSYGDKKIKKVVITYKLNSSSSADGSAIVELFHDPTKTIFIGAQVPEGGEKGPVSVTMRIRFFDEDDNEIDMSDNKAIMSLSSLNHWISDLGNHVEKVSVGENEFIKIPGSSVDLHDDYIYSDKENQRKSNGAIFDADGENGWDAINVDGQPRSATAFYGAGAMTYKGKEFTFEASGNNPYIPTTIWFSTNSVVAVPKNPGDAPQPPKPVEDPKEPTKPDPLNLTWHKNIVKETVANPIPVKPVIPKTITSVETPKPQPQTPTTPIPVEVADPKPAAPVQKQTTLPQTGDSSGYGLAAFGVGIVLYATLTLLGSRKMDENND
ncbi:GbpC/Spa domain-containing protein [Streptococcus sobrinus]|uniref:Glucan-binding protein C2 n=1 Tax=Streptococcus sobrinus TaxID=1310 RepID=A8QYL2_9STRE|nr:GbpC/Spa domain-containing protein [Streptococcus sobrinus]AWN61312.1 glucan-binding protein [Streptococcus sobrinus]AWN63185.1 glucan-binding protein [Streptococcus sobrinus]SQG19497.1 Glucan-binding protein C [Streptococcus sobrinus]BAF91363.1 glucan-binding protein C2 [Streptococcus sobrinus]BAG80676.1 glucan-binding protein C2 [Streptococcus sobrinus]